MEILNKLQITQKINRIAIQILERNLKAKELVLAGINNNGLGFAKKLQKKLQSLTEKPVQLRQIRLNPADPLDGTITLDEDINTLTGKVVIVVDDVANTGRTIFYAIKPLLNILPQKVEVAVLVDRTHKSFPIHADYVGLSLATTLKENIEVNLSAKSASVNLN